MSKQSIGIGVIGAGIWGGHHAEVFSILPNAKLIAVCDKDESRARNLATTYGAIAQYSDHKALLEDPRIAAVSVATPDFTHTAIILDALAAGKHVLSEKPLAMSVEEAEKVVATAEVSDAILMVDFHNRVNPLFSAARDDIRSGAIGTPVHGSACLSNTQFVPLEMLGWAEKSSALWFLGSHAVDTLRFLLSDEVVRVFSMSASGVLQSKGVNTEDVHVSMLEFSEGTIVTLENSWVLSDDNPQIFEFAVNLVGDAGQLQLDPSHNGAYRHLGGKGLRFRDMFGVIPSGPGRIGGFVQEAIASFVDTISDGTPLLAGAKDGLAVTRTLVAIEQSARTGLPVDIIH